MDFCERLNVYMKELSVTNSELSKASGLSPASISRYRSGAREPGPGSIQVEKLAAGLAGLAAGRQDNTGSGGFSYDEILSALNSDIQGIEIDYDSFISNLRQLLSHLDVRPGELARGIYSDPSYISKILSGSRRPGDVGAFIGEVSTYLTRRLEDSRHLTSLAQLTGADAASLRTSPALYEHIFTWLSSGHSVKQDDSLPGFLTSMDDFDLNDYLKAVRFDEIRLPHPIPQLGTRREYLGINKMMESELDFIKATVLSKSDESCILYSDMPLEEMAADADFPDKFLLGMAMLLKKGLHLNIIHDVSRPFEEMMLGLEHYIPMYMTGQISPYYLPATQSNVFSHLLKVSGAAALEGNAITGSQAGGRYVLYRSKEDVAHYRGRAEDLLAKARPLMEIFRSDGAAAFESALCRALSGQDLKCICSNLPLYLCTPETFEMIMDDFKAPPGLKSRIEAYYAKMRSSVLPMPGTKRIHITVPWIAEQDYAYSPVSVSLADSFIEERYELPYALYRRYIEDIEQLAEKQPGLTIEPDPSPAFRNINLLISGDRMVIVSKEKSPAIHFVIYHRRMIRAFRNFVPPAAE